MSVPHVRSDQRQLPFEACFNFRDVGGYETADGRRVRWRAVFRSGTLHRLTPADREMVSRLGVRTVVDLRSTTELEREGGFGAADAVRVHHVPLDDDAGGPIEVGGEPRLADIYVSMARSGRSAVAAALRIIAEGEHPVVVHCFAGKDRTGIIAALLLSSLGVPDATISADYQLSNDALAPSIAWAEDNDPEWAAHIAGLPPWVLQAPASAMTTFLETLRAHHGSIDEYLVHAGLDLDHLVRLRARLLSS